MCSESYSFFFFNDPATTEIYTLSLHDALPIWIRDGADCAGPARAHAELRHGRLRQGLRLLRRRSEEHTSELQSQFHLVCRLLLEKKKKIDDKHIYHLVVHPNSPLRGRERLMNR